MYAKSRLASNECFLWPRVDLSVLRVSGVTSSSIGLTGVPGNAVNGGTATRLVNMWIPGTKFAKSGIIQYENASVSQVKFYDYRICILCYDWFGTSQDANTIGKLNDMIVKIYFKDA
jgi:hypothetical protein